jgi:hypothetical protein
MNGRRIRRAISGSEFGRQKKGNIREAGGSLARSYQDGAKGHEIKISIT